MKNIIISIKPRFCKEIYAGSKSVELRKGLGDGFVPGAKMYIYSSSPIKAITGEALIGGVEKLEVKEIKHRYLGHACIDEEGFDDYYSGKAYGYVVFLRAVQEYRSPLSLADLVQIGFRAPQSYMYARAEVAGLIEKVKCT